MTFVHDEGHRVAAIVHDPAVLADPELVASATAAARLAVANVRLQAENAASVRDVASSRRRLVEAADDERERLGDQLRTGAEQRLAAIGDRLARAGARERRCDRRSGARAGHRPRRRSRRPAPVRAGHPSARSDRVGLGPALAELAAQAAVPVTLDVSARRFPSTHEVAAFFVCSEALANVAKYAAASRVDIGVSATAGTLVVGVADDGAGGADSRADRGCAGSPIVSRHSAARCASTARRVPAPACAPSCRSSGADAMIWDDRSVSRRLIWWPLVRRGLYAAVAGVTVTIVRGDPAYAHAGTSAAALFAQLAAGAGLLTAALLLAARRPGRGFPALLVATSIAWPLTAWNSPGAGAAFTAGLVL